jgi:hypothetical protein
MATGAVVLFEPAPIDVAILGLLFWGGLAGKLRLQPVHQIPILLLGVFALANIVSLWDPLDLVHGLIFTAVTFYLMTSMLFFCGVASAFGSKAVNAILAGYMIGAVLNIFVAVGGYFDFLPGREYFLLYGRPKGLFKDPNVYAPYIVPVAVVALSRLLAGRLPLYRQAWWSMILGIGVAGVFLSFSRAAWFNCLISLIALFGFNILQSDDARQIARKLKLAMLTTAFAACVVYLAVSVPQVNEMLQVRLGRSGLQPYDRDRFNTHSRALQTVIERPLGMGSGQSEIAFDYATHSTYLRVVGENGFFGAVSLVLLFGSSLCRSTRLALASRDPYWRQVFAIVSASLLGQFVNCAVIDSLHWRHLWVLLGLSWTAPAPAFSTVTPGLARAMLCSRVSPTP